MTTYVEYQLDEDTTILVQTTDSGSGVKKVGVTDKLFTKPAKVNFKEAMKSAKAQAKFLLDELNDLEISEGEVKFGLKTTGEFGNLAVGKLGLDVNYEVVLKWKNKDKENKSKK